MPRILLCWLAVAIATQSVAGKKFMKMFADAGIGIHCPSGNKVYIHPISGDLQLCKQQLGVYNETSCPGGTACERFPILIPGFQDYCCWSENNPESEFSSEQGEVVAPMSKLKPSVTVEPIDEEANEKIFPIDEEEEEEDLKIEMKKVDKRKKVSEEEEEEDIVWEFETTTVKPRKTKSRKVPVITTTEPPIIITSTVKTSSSRRPQCNDPDKTVLIDYGNRLRDCYFTQCLRGFKCEFNREIRRFICCGNEIDVPPAGLPYIPEPSPVIKGKPFRPNRPFGRLNDGEDEDEEMNGEKRGPRNPIVPVIGGGTMIPIGPPQVEKMIGNNVESTAMPTPNRKGKYDEDEDYEDGDGNGCSGNGCSFGRGRGNQNSGGGCEMNCRGRGGNNNDGCGSGCRRGGNRGGNSGECGNGRCTWSGNNNNNGGNNRPRRPRPDDYEENENGCEADLSGMNGGGNNGPPPPIPEPKPLCKGLQFKKSGNNKNNGGNSNRNNGPPPRSNGNGNSNGSNRPNKPSGPGSGSNRRNGPPPRHGNNGNRNSGGNRRNNNGSDNCDYEGDCRNGGGGYGVSGSNSNNNNNNNNNENENQRFSSRKKPSPPPSNHNSNGDRKVPRSVPFFPSHTYSNVNCPEGAEYIGGFTAPQCLPPAIDSCPMSHKKCLYSQRFGHHVCCQVR